MTTPETIHDAIARLERLEREAAEIRIALAGMAGEPAAEPAGDQVEPEPLSGFSEADLIEVWIAEDRFNVPPTNYSPLVP